MYKRKIQLNQFANFTLAPANQWTVAADNGALATPGKFNLNCGTGVDPTTDWKHSGQIILPSQRVERLIMICRTDFSEDYTDFEFAVYRKSSIVDADWKDGLNSNAQFHFTQLYKNLWLNNTDPKQPSVGKEPTNMIKREIVIPTDNKYWNYINFMSEIMLYMRGIGTAAGDKHCIANMAWVLG